MKEQVYREIFLWNRGIDRVRRVLQRLETASIWRKKEINAYEVRLEEIRAQLNADFAEAMAARERMTKADCERSERVGRQGKRTTDTNGHAPRLKAGRARKESTQ